MSAEFETYRDSIGYRPAIYASPFERFRYKEWFDHSFKGTLDDMLYRLKQTYTYDLPDNAFVRAVSPGWIIRRLVDYKIDHPEHDYMESLIIQSIVLASTIYKNYQETPSLIGQFEQELTRIGNDDLLTSNVVIPADPITKNATDWVFSKRTAKELVNSIEELDVLFIALGNGGIAAGLDVFLMVTRQIRSEHSVFYPMRFSRRKLKDITPHLSQVEALMLQSLPHSQVILFDEDRSTGLTLKKAKTFLDQLFEGKKEIITVSNMK